METADGITVTGHAHRADRLLIRPASGRQADTGLSARTHHWKDTAKTGHSGIESRTKSTDANLTNAPDGTSHTLTVRECPLAVRLDLAGADEFSVVCQSLLHTCPWQGERPDQAAEKGVVR
jgi:hypothetical protein